MSRLRLTSIKGKKLLSEAEETKTSTRKWRKTAVEGEKAPKASPSSYHSFCDPAEVVQLRRKLLSWYDSEKRELPWRTLAVTEADVNIRTYAVWVSEVMLQQTQVATVTDYYNRWMKKWPTVQHLAAATLQEVNQMWAGLGYYSRGKRLHEGAQKVVSELKGQMPHTVDDLLKELPGVGRYTAAAVASIALGQVAGVVDGNVTRVLCRLRAIGADSTSPAATQALWSLANVLVDPERPGDFNQAMMELGARVCTPKGPLCSRCPVRAHCHSHQKVQVQQEQNTKKLLGRTDRSVSEVLDVEDCMKGGTCPLCPLEPWDDSLGVQNFPRKPVKKAPRAERTLTCVVVRPGEQDDQEFLLTQRPNKGLLAGLWEFPSLLLHDGDSDAEQRRALCHQISRTLNADVSDGLLRHVGEVVHVFSHIQQTYVVYSARLKRSDARAQAENTQWLTRSALQGAAVSSGLKKILKLYESRTGLEESPKEEKPPKNAKRVKTSKKSRAAAAMGGARQLPLNSFFKTLKEESGS
uniref:Adenine DNA glycosylase n=1 Tax=Oryzias sinensis TaxID=183150 RepID=A0A8C7X7P9_9TELE